jgi:hypothetical protein
MVTQLRGLVLPLVASLLSGACSEVRLPEPSAALRFVEHCEDPSSDAYYLPEGTFTPASEHSDRMQRQFMSRLLSAANARSLSCGHDVEHAYRLIWAGTNVAPVIVEITQVSGTWRAKEVQFTHPRTGAQVIASKSERTVRDDDVRNLLGQLSTAEFWTVPLGFNESAGDGAAWIIEGRSGTRYRAVARANPEAKAFKDVAYTLVRLSGMKIPSEMN